MLATIIAEDFAGMRSQGQGLAERAGFEWEFQPIFVKKGDIFSNLPVRFWPQPLKRLENITLSPATKLIISIGGKGGAAGAALGRLHHLPVVQIQNPRISLTGYDLVIANQHDHLKGKNVFIARTALHNVTPARLLQSKQKWQEEIRQDADKVLGVLLGGANGRYKFDDNDAVIIAEKINSFIQNTGMRCVITPSRRTPSASLSLLERLLEPSRAVVLSGQGTENPYLGILACSDLLAVTQDSVSMISEAVATEVPVAILPLKGRSARIEYFLTELLKMGRVQLGLENISLNRCDRLDDTSLAAEEIYRRIQF